MQNGVLFFGPVTTWGTNSLKYGQQRWLVATTSGQLLYNFLCFYLSPFSALLLAVCVTDEEQHLHLIRTTENERSPGSRIIRDKTLLTILHKTHRAVKQGCVSSIRLTFSISPVVIESFSTDYFTSCYSDTRHRQRSHGIHFCIRLSLIPITLGWYMVCQLWQGTGIV